MNPEELKARTKKFALRIINLVNALPKNQVGKVIGNQIMKSGTSVGANYRAACRSKSNADFSYKIQIVEEEADETMYWLEIIMESKLMAEEKIKNLLTEASELTAIFTASGKTVKRKNIKQKTI